MQIFHYCEKYLREAIERKEKTIVAQFLRCQFMVQWLHCFLTTRRVKVTVSHICQSRAIPVLEAKSRERKLVALGFLLFFLFPSVTPKHQVLTLIFRKSLHFLLVLSANSLQTYSIASFTNLPYAAQSSEVTFKVSHDPASAFKAKE